MKQLKLVVIALVTLVVAIACHSAGNNNQARNLNSQPAPTGSAATNSNSPPTDEVAAGRQTYNQFCVKCHKQNGEGGEVDMEGVKLKAPSLREGHALRHTDQEYVKQIANGGHGMPSFKNRLDQQRINDLVRFIRHDFQQNTAQ